MIYICYSDLFDLPCVTHKGHFNLKNFIFSMSPSHDSMKGAEVGLRGDGARYVHTI